MKAMILAAGYGTRLRPYTNHTPKPLFPIAGRPLLDLIIKKLQKAGCKAVIINTHHLHHKIETYVASQNYRLAVFTRYEPQILGTGGAIKNVADFWDDQPFLVINADIVTDVDFKTVYTAHCRYHAPATLVLCDDPAFNSVAVKKNKWITGFCNHNGFAGRPNDRLLTFTGIQVLEPQVLNYIPGNTPCSSIDAFKKILADGKKLYAFIAPKGMWQEIGTPKRYKQAAIQKALPQAFERAFAVPPGHRIQWTRLKGDGSERQWHRLKTNRRCLIMVDHGIRENRGKSEIDSFVQIGRHLYRQGISVPKIYFHDTFSGLVFLEDLGDVNLQQVVQRTNEKKTIVKLYQSVIKQLIRLSHFGADQFDKTWTYQTPDYNQKLILEKECRYFVEVFLRGRLGIQIHYEDLEAEFVLLAQKALQHPTIGFMHRDMQSRNIMIKDDKCYFIDFQGGRIGPIQYDLASLLIDPYVELSHVIQSQLLDYCIEKLSAITSVHQERFRLCYYYCTLTRNLQILGAFAYLSGVKGKNHFQRYIPAALKTLKFNLTRHGQGEFPGLTAVVNEI